MLYHRTYKTDEEMLSFIHHFVQVLGYERVSIEGKFVGEGHLLFDDGQPEPPPPPPPEPPISTHYARIEGFNPTAVKPLSVIRTWNGQDYPYNCFVTQDIVDAYTAGNLVPGDYVLIHFDDSGEQIAMMKIFKTW